MCLNPLRLGFVQALSRMGASVRLTEQDKLGGEPVGVFTWAIPPAAVESVSDLLDGYVP